MKHEKSHLNIWEKDANKQRPLSGGKSAVLSEVSCFVQIPVLYLIPSQLKQIIQILICYFLFHQMQLKIPPALNDYFKE